MEEKKVPALRFRGFDNAWEQKELGELFSYLQNNTLSRAELNDNYGVAQSIHYGDVLIKYGECLDVSKERLAFIEKQSIADKFKTAYLQDGDIIVADTAEDGTVGKCTEIQDLTDKKIISGLHTIPLRPDQKFASGYLGFYMNSNSYHDQLKPLMQGIKVTSISKSAIQNTVVRYPFSLKEQGLVSRYLCLLNTLISLHQRKLEMLKKVKKSMLEKMFPKNDAKVPEVRFSDFTDAWEQYKLSHFAQRESVFRSSSSEYPSVEYEDVVSERGCLNKDIRLKETEKTGIAFDGMQVLYGKLRPYLHNWLNPDFTGVAVGDWWVLRPVGIDKKFLYRLIQTRRFDEVANQSSGSKMPRADWNLVSNTEFIIPYSLDEQRQIAETFDSLDHLISLHQRKLEKLKNIKKSMLEKMFII